MQIVRLVWVTASIAWLPATALADASDPIPGAQAMCQERVATLGRDIRSATLWRGGISVVSAAIAAIGSAVAGFAKKTTVRRVTGIAGAIGATVATIPLLVPNSDELEKVKKVSEQHRLFGDKVRLQLTTIKDEGYALDCTRYVLARYVSCASSAPEPDVPGLPTPQPNTTAGAVHNIPAVRRAPAAPPKPAEPHAHATSKTAEAHADVPPERPLSHGIY